MKHLLFRLAAFAVIAAGFLLIIQNVKNANQTSFAIRYNAADTSSKSKALFADSVKLIPYETARTATYKNLQVFILEGDADDAKHYTTLQDALEKKLVTVHETGEVNQLTIDNASGDFVYINSGDIVKGGQQDRTIPYDVVIAPHKMHIDVSSFCVEHSRWNQRQEEAVELFESSKSSLSSKELKLAAKSEKSQQKVWDKVNEYQDKANVEIKKFTPPNVVADVKSPVSESSLQLTLENTAVQKLQAAYKQHFSALKNIQHAVGIAYCINGKFYSMDVYNNHELFADMFDKLLDAAITEAISEDASKTNIAAVAIPNEIFTAKAFVYEDFDVNEITRFQSAETGHFTNLAIFTSFDKTTKTWLHRNWLDKSGEKQQVINAN